ncbi:MAG: M64 family metallopeptidase, partial [Planctomycetota bacterium]
DNDPVPGVLRDTAMDMGFNCDGVQVCVNFFKAYQFANNAPAVDFVLAIGNSSSAAGYGWFSGIAAVTGTGPTLYEIVQHELGHSIGRLADEYDYGDGATYSGGEIPRPNVSIRTASEMASTMNKWFRWLGVDDPAFDGLVSTYEGAHYHQFGIYRPTAASLMRYLGRPFNHPSAEALIFRIYDKVNPIDDSSSTSAVYDGTETLYVSPIPLQGPPMAIQWYLDGTEIAGATGPTLDLSSVALPPCDATVSVKVTDTTPMVRNETQREALMTETRAFDVRPPFSSYCTGAPNSTGAGASMLHGGSTSVSANDLLLIVDGCPTHKPGFFVWGQDRTNVPLGNGFGCIGSNLKRFPVQRTDPFGYADRVVDLNAPPGGDSVSPGGVRNVQFYYRDPAAGGAYFNLSDALSLRFCP